MTEIAPLFLDADNTYAAKFLRQFWRNILTEGIFTSSCLEVTEKGTPDMSVNVAAGWGLVQGDQSSEQGHYLIRNDATVNKAIAAADGSNPRIDRVIAQIKDSTDISGSDDEWEIQVLTGTPAASPSAPSLPDDALDLALVAVGAGVSSIVNANITDQRSRTNLQNVNNVVLTSGNQTIAGVKTFSSTPVGPASDPTTDNQLARKKYVDDSITDFMDYEATSEASSATPTPTGNSKRNLYTLEALATDPTFAAPSGTPTHGNMIFMFITDDGTSRSLSYNAIYDDPYSATLPTATAISKTILMLFIYNSATSKWELINTDEAV